MVYQGCINNIKENNIKENTSISNTHIHKLVQENN